MIFSFDLLLNAVISGILIGGFYAYDNQEKVTHLAGGCTTGSDSTGRAECRLAPGISGEVIAVARVTDAQGHETSAVRTVWLAGKDAWWFGGDNGDLVPVPTKHEGWGVMPNGGEYLMTNFVWPTEESALAWLGMDTRPGHIVHVTWED